MTLEEATQDVHVYRGPYYKVEWMHTLFVCHQANDEFNCSGKTYMMMPVGCTIFAYKTFTCRGNIFVNI